MTYDGTNAARILINENYLRFTSADQAERRDAQGRVANAVFDALNTRHVSLIKLAAKLQDLARARHLAAWSSLPSEEQLWEDVGAAGVRSPNDLLVASQDLGASKLDFYVSENVAMKVQPEGDNRRVDLTISLTNPVRQQTSAYIDGGGLYAKPGEYGFYLVVNLPHDAFDIAHDDPSWTSAAEDGTVLGDDVHRAPPVGSAQRCTFRSRCPLARRPSMSSRPGRILPATWTWGGRRFNDTFPTALNLGAVAVGPEGPLPGWLLSGLVLFAFGAALTGDAWGRAAIATDGVAGRRAKIDSNLGWWLLVLGLAMVAVQITIYITLR